MATIDISESTFNDTVNKPGIVLVDFWAEWCGPCRMFAPVFEKVSGERPEITFAKVDTEAEQSLAGAMQISSIPTLMAFRDGILVFAQPGALPEQSLNQLVDAVVALDMDDVRRQIEQEAATES